MKEQKKYITAIDRIIGFFNPAYLKKREEYVMAELKKEGWPRTITLSEAEKRIGVRGEINDLCNRLSAADDNI